MFDKCRIKTKEQFLEECRMAGISADWYAFTCDRSKPVSIDENTVYYQKTGKTIVAYPFHRWDIAFTELLRYKEEYEWEATGAPFRIIAVTWEPNANISSMSGGRTMRLREYRFSKEPEQEMLDEGWVYDHYDWYMGYSVYHKTVSNGSVMRNSFIVFEFMKRTDKRDAEMFGFVEGVYLKGSYRYPVPRDLRDQIVSAYYSRGRIPDDLKDTLTQRLAKNLLDDEFEALRELQEIHRNALSAAFDPKLSDRDQKNAFAEASKRAEAGNPAVDNYYESRCQLVKDANFHRAYDQAGLGW